MDKPSLGLLLSTEVVALGLLAGCGATFDYDALRASKAPGDGFAQALSREYKDFALFESDEMWDWPEAAHFGEKSLLAAKGAVPLPEDLRGRWLPAEHVGELVAARARLTAALHHGAARRWPADAAVAQVRFDCWVEQQEENWQTADIARCRNGFHAAMHDIERRMTAAAMNDRSGAVPAVARDGDGGRPAAGATHAFIVPFAFASAELAGGADETIAAIAEFAGAGKDVRIGIGGHADRAGSDAYNERLSWRRAEALSKALIDRGIAAERISVNAFGERRPLVPTPDGMPETHNRRVEVTVGPASPL
jgi:OOP family OmpA-OmpF porin